MRGADDDADGPAGAGSDNEGGNHEGLLEADYRGRVVLVTGGTRGIGRVIAERFLACGAQVAICGRRAPELPVRSRSRHTQELNEAVFFAADVRKAEAAEALVDAVVGRFGKLHVLINNAGGTPFKMAAEGSPSFHEKIIQLNLVAPLHLSQAANAVMQAGGGGTIVNIASVSAERPSPGTAAYGAAKAGLLSLTSSLAVEWAPKVRVCAVTAGLIRTEQAHLHYGDEAGIARVASTVPMGRLGRPQDVAAACLYLASTSASYVSGTSITLHGGGEWPGFMLRTSGG